MRNAMVVLFVGSSVLLGSTEAHAQECNAGTYIPSCEEGNQNQLRYCDAIDGVEKVKNCDAFTDTCAVLDCVGQYCSVVPVAGCIGPSPEACAIQTASNVTFPAFCQDSACLRQFGDFDEERCTGSLDASCSDGEDGLGCIGDIASRCLGAPASGVTLVSPVLTDCASYGSQCAAGENGASSCRGGAGASCDDLTLRKDSLLTCQSGFACVGATVNATGTCQSTTDGGTAIDAGGGRFDSGPGEVDAGLVQADGGLVQADGGLVYADGGLVFADGGLVADGDGGFVQADGGPVLNADGGPVYADGGLVFADGGLVFTDGGLVQVDSGPAPVDGGQTTTDAGDTDGGAPGSDGGGTPVPTDGGPFGANACGDGVTALGECSGDTLRFCQAGVIEEFECAALGRVCAVLGPTVGSDCVRAEDAPPADGEAPVASVFCLCASPGEGPPAAALLLGLLVVTLRRRRRRR